MFIFVFAMFAVSSINNKNPGYIYVMANQFRLYHEKLFYKFC